MRADVISHPDIYRDDYFPYGMLLPNRHESSNEYRYGYQGSEKDDEIKGEGNFVNYKYRMHDPRVGRFFAVDPLEYKFSYYSPYQFSSNSPIMAIELEGLESSVKINYNEHSITISRNKNNYMTVTKNQLSPIIGNYYTSNGSTTDDLSPGGQYEVWCSDCARNGEGGNWVTLKIPTEGTVRKKTMEVTEIIVVTERREVKGESTSFEVNSLFVGHILDFDDVGYNLYVKHFTHEVQSIADKGQKIDRIQLKVGIDKKNEEVVQKTKEELEKKFNCKVTIIEDKSYESGKIGLDTFYTQEVEVEKEVKKTIIVEESYKPVEVNYEEE